MKAIFDMDNRAGYDEETCFFIEGDTNNPRILDVPSYEEALQISGRSKLADGQEIEVHVSFFDYCNRAKNPAAVALGQIKTERKTQSSRANITKAREAIKTDPKPCTCGKIPHGWNCPVKHRERMQAIRAKKA